MKKKCALIRWAAAAAVESLLSQSFFNQNTFSPLKPVSRRSPTRKSQNKAAPLIIIPLHQIKLYHNISKVRVIARFHFAVINVGT